MLETAIVLPRQVAEFIDAERAVRQAGDDMGMWLGDERRVETPNVPPLNDDGITNNTPPAQVDDWMTWVAGSRVDWEPNG